MILNMKNKHKEGVTWNFKVQIQVLKNKKILLNILQVNLTVSKISHKVLFKENIYQRLAPQSLIKQIFTLMDQWPKFQYKIQKSKWKNCCNKKW